jgi:hypothetical protein
MWTLAFGHHQHHTPTHGYAPTRETAMAAFGKIRAGNPRALGYPDRLLNSLLRRDAAEKSKVGRPNGLWRQKPLRQAMVNGADPAGVGCRLAGNQGKRIVIEVKVQQIEIVSPLPNLL